MKAKWWNEDRSRHGGVDEVPVPRVPGRLWLCGKHFIGPDPEAALERTGADVVVCLNDRSELNGRYPDYVHWLEAAPPSRALWRPVPDLHAPPLDDAEVLLADLRQRLESGDGLLIHCGAGLGRAGTVAAALLLTLGASNSDAHAAVAAARPAAGPQKAEQREFLRARAARCGRAPTS